MINMSSLISLVLAFCFHPTTQKGLVSNLQRTGKFSLDVPHAAWEPLFFSKINGRAKAGNLSNLRARPLPDGDLEVRVWGGFGVTKLSGYAIKREKGQWSTIYIPPIVSDMRRYPNRPVSPKSNWTEVWNRLQEEGILTLPDSSQLEDEVRIEDGISYVVEVNANYKYRTYMYANPKHQKWPEAQRMLNIIGILEQEFDIK